MDKALSMNYGLSATLPTPYLASHYRRKLYAERERLKKSGNTAYNLLRFLIRNRTEIWIIKREAAISTPKIEFINCYPLTCNELSNRDLNHRKSH